MQAKRGRPRKVEPIIPEPLKIAVPPKPRRRFQAFETDWMSDIMNLADKMSERWPKTSESLFATAWIHAKEMYDECAPKLEYPDAK